VRKSELLALLARIPGDPEIVTWQNETKMPVEGQDTAIEQVFLADRTPNGAPLQREVVVLGMEIPANDLGGELVWSTR
jgi:hypothetical protein